MMKHCSCILLWTIFYWNLQCTLSENECSDTFSCPGEKPAEVACSSWEKTEISHVNAESAGVTAIRLKDRFSSEQLGTTSLTLSGDDLLVKVELPERRYVHSVTVDLGEGSQTRSDPLCAQSSRTFSFPLKLLLGGRACPCLAGALLTSEARVLVRYDHRAGYPCGATRKHDGVVATSHHSTAPFSLRSSYCRRAHRSYALEPGSSRVALDPAGTGNFAVFTEMYHQSDESKTTLNMYAGLTDRMDMTDAGVSQCAEMETDVLAQSMTVFSLDDIEIFVICQSDELVYFDVRDEDSVKQNCKHYVYMKDLLDEFVVVDMDFTSTRYFSVAAIAWV